MYSNESCNLLCFANDIIVLRMVVLTAAGYCLVLPECFFKRAAVACLLVDMPA